MPKVNISVMNYTTISAYLFLQGKKLMDIGLFIVLATNYKFLKFELVQWFERIQYYKTKLMTYIAHLTR